MIKQKFSYMIAYQIEGQNEVLQFETPWSAKKLTEEKLIQRLLDKLMKCGFEGNIKHLAIATIEWRFKK